MSIYEVWTEKYRPQSLDDIAGHSITINKIKQNVAVRNITNWILKGPAGTGKTSCVYAIAYAIYGKGNLNGNFKEINASSKKNRGIDMVETDIIPFAKHRPIFMSSPFRLLFLEEADQLTIDAQAALRRTMEKYTNNCRFILAVNNVDKIIDPIRSRCTEFPFNSIKTDILVRTLKAIASNENLKFSENQYSSIAERVNGDLRKATNILQNMQVDQSDYGGVFG